MGQSLGGHWTITAPAVGFGLGLYGDMKIMHGKHGKNSPDSNRKSKMPRTDSSSKREKTEKLLLQESIKDTKNVRRDSG